MEQSPATAQSHNQLKQDIQEHSIILNELMQKIQKHIIGQSQAVETIILALLSNNHILLEGLPGVAKTTMIKSFAQVLGLEFKRIQFTPDLLPSDLIGTLVFNQKTQDFETKKGPLFANLILADEINRAPAKVQAALLQAMEEKQVTIGSQTFDLPQPFFVFATQNPIEQEGTYNLPEAQVDRFMLKAVVNYPTAEEEKKILAAKKIHIPLHQVIPKENLQTMQGCVQNVYVDELIVDYIVRLVDATRNPESHNLNTMKSYILHGASPRATLALYKASQAYAFLHRRHFVIPEDVKAVAYIVLRHRIMLSFEANCKNIHTDTLVTELLEKIRTP